MGKPLSGSTGVEELSFCLVRLSDFCGGAMTVMVVVEDWEGLLWVWVRALLGVTAVAVVEAISPLDEKVSVLLILIVGVFVVQVGL